MSFDSYNIAKGVDLKYIGNKKSNELRGELNCYSYSWVKKMNI